MISHLPVGHGQFGEAPSYISPAISRHMAGYSRILVSFLMAILALLLFMVMAPLMVSTLKAKVPNLDDASPLQLVDIFALEYANNPQISPDGAWIVYERRSFDKFSDRSRSNLWLVSTRTEEQIPLLSGRSNYGQAQWSPDGKRLAYVSSRDGRSQIYVRWMDNGTTARLSDLEYGPSSLSWSPDGKHLAFTSFVPKATPSFVSLPKPPTGARWAPSASYIDKTYYRGDGAGYYKAGHRHIFVLSANGGGARQLTKGDYNHNGTLSWTRDGRGIYAASDRRPERMDKPGRNSIYRYSLSNGKPILVVSGDGSLGSPKITPDGRHIAYLMAQDNLRSSQQSRLYVQSIDAGGIATNGNRIRLANNLDRGIDSFQWVNNSTIYFGYTDGGTSKLASTSLRSPGAIRNLADTLGGASLGRPYAAYSFSVNSRGEVAYNVTSPTRPGDVAILRGGKSRRLTDFIGSLHDYRAIAEAEEFWVTAKDGVRTQAWLVRPPNFDPQKKYPLILEIHGGPHANYGARFSAEMQLYAAAGYLVLYTNPRGSTGYGDAFANHIDKKYPGKDYDDLMQAVDDVLRRGFVDEERLYVTGGSGGGVLTAWIVGNTDRFRAAVVAKPVINWASFVLTADNSPYFWKYWFGKTPWEDPMIYWQRSPLSLVGNVTTPTMLLTGEADYRTPISETEQYYSALKIEGVDTAMVRIPQASHGIAARPSHLITKIAYILGWFEKYGGEKAGLNAAYRVNKKDEKDENKLKKVNNEE